MTVLGPGERIPRFTAPDQSGYLWDHDDLMGRRAAVFFLPLPRQASSGAVARSLQDHIADLDALECSLFAVSPDAVEPNARFVAANGLTFPVLSDARRQVAHGFGLLQDGKIAMTTVLVGPSGRVQRVYPVSEPRLHALEVVRGILDIVRPERSAAARVPTA